MPQSIPPGLLKEHVLRALNDLDGGIDHSFGSPTGYELVHGDKRYAPKAVVGLACRYSLGRTLMPDEFSGGEAPGQANFVLRKLGFTVVCKGEDAAEAESPARKDWTEEEVVLVVADYFTMLEKELLGRPYSKAEHRRSLTPKLGGRSDGSVEFKHSNVSAVLTGLGFDVLSFDDQDESEKLIEVKTTGRRTEPEGPSTPRFGGVTVAKSMNTAWCSLTGCFCFALIHVPGASATISRRDNVTVDVGTCMRVVPVKEDR